MNRVFVSALFLIIIVRICDSCNMGTSDLPDICIYMHDTQGTSANISGKSWVRMLQLLCDMPSSNML